MRKGNIVMNKDEFRKQVKKNCSYSEAIIDYIVDKTTISTVDWFHFRDKKGAPLITDVGRYLRLFLSEHPHILIDNKEIELNLLTKFKVGDIVYILLKDYMKIQKVTITSIENQVYEDVATSLVELTRDDEDYPFMKEYLTNYDLFSTKEELIQFLLNNSEED